MTNLTRFDPFAELVRFDPLRGFEDMLRMPRAYRALPPEPEMKMDMSEDAKAFYVKAELPGVRREDIHVAIDGNEVSISAESKKETEQKQGESVVRSERYYGRVARVFSLTHSVDEARAEAKYVDGVLMLTLPKKGEPAVKEVTVN
ncbi:MAG TPA: Hsp20/alpha crystallin family protein [Casimicrobiaceae bacterium]|nr:Hsp20/alpha crystallin family protein [Casimicrobiaceae bacterium]